MKTETIDIRAIRAKRKMNQTDFWGRVGVTQSGASRYEHGRRIPNAVQRLLTIAYGPKKAAAKMIKDLRGEVV